MMQNLINEARALLRTEDIQGPKEANDIYLKCRAKNDNKEYCARVAWQVYCQNINPSYKGCTKYGKTGASKPPLAK